MPLSNEQIQQKFDIAKARHDQENWIEAIQLYVELATERHAKSFFNLAIIYLQIKNPEDKSIICYTMTVQQLFQLAHIYTTDKEVQKKSKEWLEKTYMQSMQGALEIEEDFNLQNIQHFAITQFNNLIKEINTKNEDSHTLALTRKLADSYQLLFEISKANNVRSNSLEELANKYYKLASVNIEGALSDELILRIFSYLELNDLASVFLVNKRWNEISNDPTLESNWLSKSLFFYKNKTENVHWTQQLQYQAANLSVQLLAKPSEINFEHLFYKVILVGNNGAGKSAICKTMREKSIFENDYMPKTNMPGNKFRLDKNKSQLFKFCEKPLEILFYDCSPPRWNELRNFSTQYQGIKVIVLVCDMTDKEAFDSIKEWYNQFYRFASKNSLIFLVASKLDLRDKIVVTKEEFEECVKNYNFDYATAVSAETGEGIEDLFKIAVAASVLGKVKFKEQKELIIRSQLIATKQNSEELSEQSHLPPQNNLPCLVM